MSDNLISTYYTSLSSLKRRMKKNYRTFGFKGPYEKTAFFLWQDQAFQGGRGEHIVPFHERYILLERRDELLRPSGEGEGRDL